MRYALLLASAGLLAGCNATMPQQASAPPDPGTTCFQSLPSNPQWSMLSSRIPLGDPRAATVQMLSDKSLASDEEQAALERWTAARKLCYDMTIAHQRRYAPPGVASVTDRQQLALQRLIASLYAKDITYGQFNTQRQQLLTATSQELEALRQQYLQANDRARAQAAAERDADAARNLQIMQLLQASQPRPAPLPMPGPPVICNSRPSLGGVQTVCN